MWILYLRFKNIIQMKYISAEHCENNGSVDGNIERRLIALMVYLNTVTDGGQTHFPTQNIFSPKVGDVLMLSCLLDSSSSWNTQVLLKQNILLQDGIFLMINFIQHNSGFFLSQNVTQSLIFLKLMNNGKRWVR